MPSLFVTNGPLVAFDGLEAHWVPCLLDDPTIAMLTHGNDVDDQLFDSFATSRQLLRQKPVPAENRSDALMDAGVFRLTG